MQEELISKKQLLETADISYGQLYRWKRKGLIPEDWFIKKSSFTGQETYFPKLKVLTRIEKIKTMKDDVSLDDLANVFTPETGDTSLSFDDVLKRGVASASSLELFKDATGIGEPLSFGDLLALTIVDKALASGDVGLDDARVLLGVLSETGVKVGLEASEVVLARKQGVFVCFAVKPPSGLVMESGAKLLARFDTAALSEEIKQKLL